MTKSDASHLELNGNENATSKAPWEPAKTVHGGKLIYSFKYLH